MKKAALIGHVGKGKELLNGQTIKTKTVTEELQKLVGRDQLLLIDTHGGIKAYMRLPFQLLQALCSCRDLIIFPAHNGVRIIPPMLDILNFPFRRGLHYVVIGGWLPELVKDKPSLKKHLKRFRGIYVETHTLKRRLKEQGFRNVVIMPNFKELPILKKDELVYNTCEPYKLCTFSRVMEEKGIGEAVSAVKSVNDYCGRTVFEFDIYGQVEAGQEEWFDNLQKTFPEYVRYRGVVPFYESVSVLKEYFALLFPTKFFTEGIPGTIIDAYAAGIPVISSRWESFSDIVDDGVTGIGYDFNDKKGLEKILLRLAQHPEEADRLKENCLVKAESYTPGKAIGHLKKRLGRR